MARDKLVALRLSEAGLAVVDGYAVNETAGNRSEMIRKLLKEAIEARRKRAEPQRKAWRR